LRNQYGAAGNVFAQSAGQTTTNRHVEAGAIEAAQRDPGFVYGNVRDFTLDRIGFERRGGDDRNDPIRYDGLRL
jgi:hypothetical protein